MENGSKVLIVTGGGRGIGAAIVRHAVRSGYVVCFSYAQNAEAAERLVGELQTQGHQAFAVQGDVADPDAVHNLFEQVESKLGPVTALVNNAGITGRIGSFQNTEISTLRRVLDVNVLGTMLCAHEAIRRWNQRNTAGRMVNISSIASTLPLHSVRPMNMSITLPLKQRLKPSQSALRERSPRAAHVSTP
jgi:NAD(P)-dependent dehydrogenase (short-subunit alcohol dehydrogenase family)